MRFIDAPSWLLSSWRFKRGDGLLIKAGLRFHTGGRIANYHHPNEAGWKFFDGIPAFVDERGVVTTSFDTIALTGDGRRILSGKLRSEGITLVLEEEVPHRWTRGRRLTRTPRVAVLIRTHVLNNKLFNLWRSLRTASRFDTYISIDETSGKRDLTGPHTLRHTVGVCRELGLCQEVWEQYLWFFSDYPFYCAYESIPDYDYYIQIEYDVHVVRQDPLFLEALIDRLADDDGTPFDLVGLVCTETDDRWPWTAAAKKHYPKVYIAFFPFVVLSARALLHLYDLRRSEARRAPARADLIHCEAFVGSAMLNSPHFRCVEINQLIPNTFRPETFRVGLPMLLGNQANGTETELMHPVFEAEDYVVKHIAHARATKDISHLLAAAEVPELPAPLKDQLLAAAKELGFAPARAAVPPEQYLSNFPP